MTITIRLFAAARDQLHTDQVALEAPAGANVGDLRRLLAIRYPRLAALLPRCLIAINQDYANDQQLIQASDDIALIPPVSGG